MRPALQAGLLPLWRDRDTLQIGIDPRRAFTLTGIGRAAAVVSLLDGSREWPDLVQAAERHGIPEAVTNRVLALLAAAGALRDFPARLLRGLPDELRGWLTAELATASLAYGDGDGGARTLARRRMAAVRVYGADRIGSWIASLLAGSGVGRVACAPAADGPGLTRRVPRGGSDLPACGAAAGADLAVLVAGPDPDAVAELMRGRVPHLAVHASEAIGVVGPLVDPGRSACLRCLDLSRADRDAGWPMILAQASRGRCRPEACDTVLAAMVAASAAAQAVTFIDRGEAPAVRNATLELVAPDWRWRRRTWPPHPRCPCAAAGVDDDRRARARGIAPGPATSRHGGEW